MGCTILLGYLSRGGGQQGLEAPLPKMKPWSALQRVIGLLVLEGETALLGFKGSDKHEEELLVHDQLSKHLQVLHNSLPVGLLRGLEGEENRMVLTGAREEEAHCKGAEVTVGEILIGRNMDQVGQVCLELGEGWKVCVCV